MTSNGEPHTIWKTTVSGVRVSNELLNVTVRADSLVSRTDANYDQSVNRLWLEGDSPLLFHSTLASHRLFDTLKQLLSQNTRMWIRVDGAVCEVGWEAADGSSAVAPISLSKDDSPRYTHHLTDLVYRLQTERVAAADKQRDSMNENARLKERLDEVCVRSAWQEGELEVLKGLVKGGDAHRVDGVCGECVSGCRHGREEEEEGKGRGRRVPTTFERFIIDGVGEEDLVPTNKARGDESERGEQDASSSSTDQMELAPPDDAPSTAETTRDSLLLGIAQHILCALCPPEREVRLPDVERMEQHFISTHVDAANGLCRACPSEDKAAADISHHIRQHTNRIYACSFCGKRGRRHLLKAHIRTHTGEKPYACEVCGRQFADGSTLRRHRNVHTGEKKHECTICGRMLTRKDNAKVHMRSHHGVEE